MTRLLCRLESISAPPIRRLSGYSGHAETSCIHALHHLISQAAILVPPV